jgi:cytochrome c oxidase assembly factor 1
LGDEIYFASKVPWIRGELSPLQGTIDITFWVKGNKAVAQTKFVSIRKRGSEFFETLEWSLTTQDGKTIQLLQMEGTRDPISGQKL